jgi:hypothetical protein
MKALRIATCFALLLVAIAFGTFSCATSEDRTPTVDESDGIRAESRTSGECEGDACITTTLTDVASQAQLAAVTWNADAATGKITETTRTTRIIAEDMQAMTPDEANMLARATWLSLTAHSSKTGTASAAPYNEVCSSITSTTGSCSCSVTTCMFCTPKEYGENCDVHVARVCVPLSPMYVGRCG